VDGEEVGRLFTRLSDGKIRQSPELKGRFKDNSDKMRGTGLDPRLGRRAQSLSI